MRNESLEVFQVGGERKQSEIRKHLFPSISGVFSNKSLKRGWGERENLDLKEARCLKPHKKSICLEY